MADNNEKISYGFADNFGFTSPFGEDSIFSQQSREKEAAQRTLRNQQAAEKQSTMKNQLKNDEPSKRSINYSVPQAETKADSIFWKLGLGKQLKPQSESNIKLYLFYDDKGQIQKYTEADNKYEAGLAGTPILLSIGTRVAIISKDHLFFGKKHNRVILFWKNQYREGYIVEDAFNQMFLGATPEYTGNLFVNDVERILWEIEQRQIIIKTRYSYRTWNLITDEANSLCNDSFLFVKEKLQVLKQNIKKIDFEDVANRYYNQVEITNDIDYVTALSKITNFLNVKFEKFIQEKRIIILPFTKAWFYKYLFIKEIELFINKYINGNIASELDLDVGVVKEPLKNYQDMDEEDKHSSNATQYVIEIMVHLCNIITDNKVLRNSKEGKWLMANITNIKETAKIGTIIILGTGAWKILRWENKASMVAIQNSFGNIYAGGTLTVLLHEFDQGNLGYVPSDTHIDLGGALTILLLEISNSKFGEFNQKLVYEHFRRALDAPESEVSKSDMLFACNSYHSIVFLEMFFKRYLSSYIAN